MASQGTPPEGKTPRGPKKDWSCDPRAILVMLAAVSLVGALFVQFIARNASPAMVQGLVLFAGLFLLLSFLYLFTGAIGKTKMTGMVIFCYAFTAVAIVASVAPFGLFDTKWGKWDAGFRETPIGVMRGCSVESQSGTVPAEIKCAAGAGAIANYQWVVNIGGSVWSHDDPAAPAGGQTTITPAAATASGDVPGQDCAAAQAGAAAKPAPVMAVSKPADPPPDTQAQPGAQPDYARIHGGIVVPLYVIVLALVGGAVSMTRRVPEYQRQVWSHYWCDDEGGRTSAERPAADQGQGAAGEADAAAAAAKRQQPDKDVTVITGPAAREYLVFQLMQVISAPLIAVAAYYAFAPANPAASVAVGFASGFTSETILLGIRGLAEKLTPSDKVDKSA